MRPYELRRADEIRFELIFLLGGHCTKCGTKGQKKNQLEIHHIYGCDWNQRSLNRYQRHLRYAKEHKLGLIELLCSKCNKQTKPKPRPDDQPF